ncbi:MAG TPA: choice-of-anchor D domain-containing protein, partial [Candidatus Binatus sp.]|nr:choice-of-anchor D domain-containing protein [Candidatus Binatus sp.]
GWILGYDETSLAQVVVYNTTPNGSEGGIWQAGCGPGVDTNGDLIVITGNGTFDTGAPRFDYGDSFMRLTPGASTLSVATFFTPLNEELLADDDLDMGSGGNLMLPDQPGPNPHLMVSAGKASTLYLVNRDSMGGFDGVDDEMVQEVQGQIGGLFSTLGYWQGNVGGGLQNMIYAIAVSRPPKMFVLAKGLIQTPAASVASALYNFGYPGASPVISANGTTGGIMWAINSAAWESGGPAILYAFDATNLRNELYDSNKFSSDNAGPAVKFAVPTVANGSVYVGTQNQLDVYGLLANGRPGPTPTATATVTPTSTGTPAITPTATVTATLTATATPTTTSSSTAGATSTPTATSSGPATSTPTVTLTSTPTATISATPTGTPVPTSSPSPVFATLYANPKSISFKNQVIGRPSKTANITVHNTAALASVTMEEPTASSGFVVMSNNCPTVLKPGATCTIGVASMPVAKGKQAGQLFLHSNAQYGTRSIQLKGKGLEPKLKVKTKSVSFEPVAPDAASSSQTIAIVNDSAAPISFTSAPAATPPFNVTASTCGTLAPNGGACTVSVEFDPHTRGKYVGILELRNTAANSPQHVKLVGVSK